MMLLKHYETHQYEFYKYALVCTCSWQYFSWNQGTPASGMSMQTQRFNSIKVRRTRIG
jgi:hypothetical protein